MRIEHSPRPDGQSRIRVLFVASPLGAAEPKQVPDEHSLRAGWFALPEILIAASARRGGRRSPDLRRERRAELPSHADHGRGRALHDARMSAMRWLARPPYSDFHPRFPSAIEHLSVLPPVEHYDALAASVPQAPGVELPRFVTESRDAVRRGRRVRSARGAVPRGSDGAGSLSTSSTYACGPISEDALGAELTPRRRAGREGSAKRPHSRAEPGRYLRRSRHAGPRQQ